MHRPLYATNETNPSTYHRTPSGRGLRPSFRPFCTIFLHPQEAVTKLFEFYDSLLYLRIYTKKSGCIQTHQSFGCSRLWGWLYEYLTTVSISVMPGVILYTAIGRTVFWYTSDVFGCMLITSPMPLVLLFT